MSDIQQRAPSPLMTLAEQVEKRTDSFAVSLPAHIPVERFKKVIVNAAMKNPKLATADRPSLIQSALLAAQDGLLPDGREAAFVIFNSKVKVDGQEKWIDAVQYMPMVAGTLKKIRNSGQVKSIVARVVFEGDTYRYWVDGDGEHLNYEPCDNPGKPVRVFAMAKTKDDELLVEPMTMAEVQKVRNVSRAKNNGPWGDWFEEMAKKTAIKRLAKRLPMSTDLDDLIRRDDALYDMEGASDKKVEKRPELSDFSEREYADEPTGNVAKENQQQAQQAQSTVATAAPEETPPASLPAEQAGAGGGPDTDVDMEKLAFEDGAMSYDEGKSIFDCPDKLMPFQKAWKNGWQDQEMRHKARGK